MQPKRGDGRNERTRRILDKTSILFYFEAQTARVSSPHKLIINILAWYSVAQDYHQQTTFNMCTGQLVAS